MESQPQKEKARIRWLRPRFSMGTFVIFTFVLCISLASVIQGARHQRRICEQLHREQITFELTDPHGMLQSLPAELLNAEGGHWCRRVKRASIRLDSDNQSVVQTHDELTKQLSLLAQLSHLARIEISCKSLGDDRERVRQSFSLLKDISSLQRIEIRTDDTDAVLEAIPELPGLSRLSILDWARKIDQVEEYLPKRVIDLSLVRKFPRLESIELTCEHVARDDLSPLVALKYLKSIYMNSFRVSKANIETLTGHPSLQHFEFASNYCTDEVLRILATCPKLKSIDASDSLITDQGLSYLKESPRLEELRLSKTSIGDVGFASLADCKSLTSIECKDCKLTDAIGASLINMPQLESLDISGSLATSKLLTDLRSLKNLQELEFNPLRSDLSDILAFVKDSSPGLQWRLNPNWRTAASQFQGWDGPVDLTGVHGLSGKLGQLRSARSIDRLFLSGTDINDDDLKDLQSLKNLKLLDISHTKITASGLSNLGALKSLETLVIGPLEDANQGILDVAKLSNISQLSVVGAVSLDESARDALVAKTNLYYLTLPGCIIDERFELKLSEMTNLIGLESVNCHWDYLNHYKNLLHAYRKAYGASEGLKKYLVKTNFYADVAIVDESELDELNNIYLESLSCANIELSHASIKKLAMLYFRELDLSNTHIVDRDLLAIANRGSIRRLDLSGNSITDRAVKILMSFNQLDNLGLANTQVSDNDVARILNSHKTSELDLSGTSVSDHAWDGYKKSSTSNFLEVKLARAPNLSSILQKVPIELLPVRIVIEDNGFYLNAQWLEELRLHQERNVLGTISISPALAGVWSHENVLNEEKFIDRLRMNQTEKAAEIFNQISQYPVRGLEITDEKFDTLGSTQFPKTVRVVELNDCVLTTDALEAMTKCPWLRQIKFTHCDLSGCSLEPLARIAMLWGVDFERTALSDQQSKALEQLRPQLGHCDW